MFKKSKLAMVVAAASLGAVGTLETAQAAYVNTDGTGQVLILPYYNVNNNFSTQIGITNTTDLFKAIKIRFRESGKSQDVLDFNVYLSPYDQWTASVRLNPDTGTANLVSSDESCTYPKKDTFQGDGVDFIFNYENVDAEDVTEGYIEIIELGVIADGPDGPAVDLGQWAEDAVDGIPDGVLGDTAEGVSMAVVDGIVHQKADDPNPGVPWDCDVIFRAWNNDGFTAGRLATEGVDIKYPSGAVIGVTNNGVAFDENPTIPYLTLLPSIPGDPTSDPIGVPGYNAGLVAPTGGVSAYAILLENETGGAFVQEATAIDGYSTVQQHYRSDDFQNYLLPSLASGNILYSSMTYGVGGQGGPLDGLYTVNQVWPLSWFDTGAMIDITPNEPVPMGANPFPVAAILSATALDNQYFVDPTISGSTDWVLTFPMRKHGIYNGGLLSADLDENGTPCPGGYFGARWPDCPTAEDKVGYKPKAVNDVLLSVAYWDAEEQEKEFTPDDPVVSPPIQGQPDLTILDREANVVSFALDGGDTDSVLGSPNANDPLDVIFTGGWMRLGMPDYSYQDDLSARCLVLPADTFPLLVDSCNRLVVDPLTNVFFIPDLDGVPTLGFAALDGDIGTGNAGETVQFVRHVDRDGTGFYINPLDDSLLLETGPAPVLVP